MSSLGGFRYRGVRVVVPESLLTKGEILWCAEDSERDGRTQASARTEPGRYGFRGSVHRIERHQDCPEYPLPRERIV
jgi:hypothetical protein